MARKQIAETLASAMAKPVEVEIRGEKFQVTPISIDDLAEFESKIKSRRLSEAMIAAKEAELPSDEKIQILREIQKQPITGDALTEEMSTMSGIQFILWRMLLRYQARLTLQQVGRLIDFKNLEEMSSIVSAFSGLEPEDIDPKAQEEEEEEEEPPPGEES